MVEGDVVYGSVMAGQVSAMVKEIQPAREIVMDVVRGAAELLSSASRWVVTGK
jgi:enoyl-[acyl-carrier protein] reductase II